MSVRLPEQAQAHGLEARRCALQRFLDSRADAVLAMLADQPQHHHVLLMTLARDATELAMQLFEHRRERPLLQGGGLWNGAWLVQQQVSSDTYLAS